MKNRLEYFNGYGGFDLENNDYVILLASGKIPPKPWINILANQDFGSLVTESGSMYSWYGNSSLFRITPRVDNYISEESGELIYLKNQKTGKVWLATPGNPKETDPEYIVRHGLGYTVFSHDQDDLSVSLTVFVSRKLPRKYIVINIKNNGSETKNLSATYFSQFVLDEYPERSRSELTLDYCEQERIITARNYFSKYYPQKIVYLATTGSNPSYCLDRKEFFGLNNHKKYPKALAKKSLSNQKSESNDPCGALQTSFVIPPGKSKQISFILGVTEKDRLSGLKSEISSSDLPKVELAETTKYWQKINATIQIETPNRPLNIIFNSRLLYQTLSSRLWAKTGFYQPGGAFGFRDQLQDVDALVWAEPEKVREHLLLSASRQFAGGNVQQWWHPPRGDGVRSLSSDAHLWLVHVLNHYLRVTEDYQILEEKVPYLDSHNPEHQYNSYFVPIPTAEKFSVYEHAISAIERTLYLTGERGLPLILSGDWNDSLSRIGAEKKGESVFLAMFLVRVLTDFICVCQKQKDHDRAERYQKITKKLTKILNNDCWDGNWYLRAFWDNGKSLGTHNDTACQIDGLVQNWAVISGIAPHDKADSCLAAVDEHLFDRDNNLIKLLDPPFSKEYHLDPGYIVTYPPGTRENGGAYSHNGAWSAKAFALNGNGQTALDILDSINPIYHTMEKSNTELYGGEPYALAGDIYSWGGYAGKAGWTWYTGSAAVYYSVVVENVLGLIVSGDRLNFAPCVPKSWKRFSAELRYDGSCYKINYSNDSGVSNGIKKVTLDGKKVNSNQIRLKGDRKTHFVEITMG